MLSDLEMAKLCAEAMGLAFFGGPYEKPEHWIGNYETMQSYDPLHDDAQAMALVKRFKIATQPFDDGWLAWAYYGENSGIQIDRAAGLNYAIVECVAKMRSTGAESSAGPSDNAVSE